MSKITDLDESVLSQILTQAPGHIAYWDTDYRLRYLNRVAHGYRMEEVMGASLEQFGPQTAAQTRQAMETVVSGEEECSFENFLETPNGGTRCFLQRISAVRDDTGTVLGFITVITDHTEQKRAELARDKALEESRVASWMAGQAEMARTVIHNVGNVLNSALVTTSVLQEQIRSARVPQLQKAVEMLLDNRDDLQAYVTKDPKGLRLMEYLPKLATELAAQHESLADEAKRLQENLTHVTSVVQAQRDITAQGGLLERVLPQEVADVAIQLSTFGSREGEALVVREFSELEPIVMDRHLVLQVLINLLQNAWDAMMDLPSNNRRVCVGVEKKGDAVEFSVQDSGPGVATELKDKVFQAGFSTKPTGSGLGLHTSANAARSMGGTLVCRSSGGEGAVFVLALPSERQLRQAGGNTRAA
ncbi:MAG: PAS domain-containing protein [Myxococcales bacterium]|nr:PAS domain-containing protein [Myxococcales bacterium]